MQLHTFVRHCTVSASCQLSCNHLATPPLPPPITHACVMRGHSNCECECVCVNAFRVHKRPRQTTHNSQSDREGEGETRIINNSFDSLAVWVYSRIMQTSNRVIDLSQRIALQLSCFCIDKYATYSQLFILQWVWVWVSVAHSSGKSQY